MSVTSVPGEEAAARAHAPDASGDAASTVIPHIRPRALVVGAALIPIAVGVSQSLEVAGNYPGLAQGPYPSNYVIPFPVVGAGGTRVLLAGRVGRLDDG